MSVAPREISVVKLPSDQDASGRSLGDEELRLVGEALASGTLTSTKGTFTKQLERRFATWAGAKHAHAISSGSTAIHAAIAALDPEPGDEIVTTSITDMGAISPILYQGAIPVFCDVESETANVSARTIEAVLSPRTKAIVVTHLFGNPCEMGAIVALASRRGIPIIEDCAQAYGATVDGRHVGTFGALGCFSLQQGKHITTGEGGLVVSDDDLLARRVFLFINKAYGYGDANADHYFLAPNARISELVGAVALAQLDKLDDAIARRIALANELTRRLAGLPGVRTPQIAPNAVHTYWKYALRIDGDVVRGGSPALAKKLAARGIASAPRYIQKPAFACQVIREQRTFGTSRWPFTLARPEAVDYAPERFPGTYRALEEVLVVPWNDKYAPEHLDAIAEAVLDGATELAR